MLESSNLSETFLEHLVVHEVIDTEAAMLALNEQRRQTPPIGRLALTEKCLTMKQTFEVLRLQADSGLRFGEQAVALGYLVEDQVDALLQLQRDVKPGVGSVLFELGLAKKGVLQKCRRAFMRELEAVLT